MVFSRKIDWLIVVNPFIMTLLIYIWSSIPISSEPDNIVFRFQSLFKHSYLNEGVEQRSKALEEVLFVDVSGDKSFIEDSVSKKRIIITDRERLSNLLTLLKETEYRYIICDLIFDYPTKKDIQLKSSIDSLKNIAFATDYSQPNVFEVPYSGTTGYEFKKNGFLDFSENALKFRMIDKDANKTLALAVYEDISNNQLYQNNFCVSGLDYSKRMNYQKLDAYIFPQDTLPAAENSVSLWYMHDILNHPDAFKDYAQDKIIVIGDLKNDIIDTAFGEMPGSMVQYNLFKNIEDNNSEINFWQILFVFFSCTFYTFLLVKFLINFKLSDVVERIFLKRNLIRSFFISIIGNISIDFVLMLTISSISYWYFNFPIEVFPLITWLLFIRFLINEFYIQKEKIL